MNREYRKLATKRGIYFVVWRPDDVLELLIKENLSPADLLTSESRETHYLIRDLYLLACAGTLNSHNNKQMNMLSRYARKLHLALNIRH